jgi:hypothetical protein
MDDIAIITGFDQLRSSALVRFAPRISCTPHALGGYPPDNSARGHCILSVGYIQHQTPLLYSERHNAFFRLQKEIIRITTFTQPLQGTSPSRLYCLHGPTVPELPPCIKYRRSSVGEGLFRRMKLHEIPHLGLPEAPHRLQVEVVEGYVIANALTCSIQSRNVAS